MKADVEPLPHAEATEGDVSTHKMCASCREHMISFSCPFCRGKILAKSMRTKEIDEFVDSFVKKMCKDAKHGDQHVHAAWLETWEAFEFSHGAFISDTGEQHTEGRPDVVAQVAALVVQEKRFAELLQDGIAKAQSNGDGNTWLCNGAGIVFRLHGLLENGSLAVSPALAALLRKANEVIFASLDKGGWNGAHLGCCYMQALSAWLSACRCGSGDTAADAAMVARVGRAVAKQVARSGDKAREVRSHTIESYVRLATKDVYGGKDPVLRCAF